MNPLMTRLGRAFLASVLLMLLAGAAVVAAADVGHKDFADSTASAVTASKPESKLWYNDGIWWASMQPSTGGGFFIYKLNSGTDTWVSTGVALDNRNATRSDTLWDGTKLYVASQNFNESGSLTGGTARLYRFSYNNSTDTYTPDIGFPVTMRSNIRSESLVIAKDSTNTLWATWTQPVSSSNSSRLVYTNHTVNGNDANWSTPVVLPIGNQPVGVTTSKDDISTIIAFTVGSEHRIGVYWSNQTDDADYFAWRVDGSLDTTVWTAETALSGSGQADDHMNIKTDSSGQLYVVVKTSLTGSNPLIKLLRRTTTGSWSNYVVGIDNVGSNTRPILELEEKGSGNVLHVFMTGARTSGGSGQSGGDIFEKTSPVSNISFAAGLGTTVIRDDASAKMNNATSTKQNVTSTTGIVVEAFNDTTDFYWHSHDTLGGGPPQDPQPAFTQDKTTGTLPLTVNFTNQSTGTPTLTYAWDFGDPGSGGNNTSTLTNPSHVYNTAGIYTVKLTTTNGNSQSNTLTETNLITVNAPSSTITLTPDADAQVKSDSATNNYGALTSIRTREDPGTGATYRSYLRFNVTGLTGSVTGVKLRLYASDASTDIESVYPILTNPNWIETGANNSTAINWNNAPSIGSTLFGAASVPTINAYNEIPLSLTSVPGNGLVTFAIKSSGTNSAIFNSKEFGSNPPQLVITQTTAPANTPPTAAATGKTTGEDTAATVDLSATDPETCELGFEIVVGPSHGSLGSISGGACTPGSPNSDVASVVYTPAANYSGGDSFTYRATDPTDPSAPATATLTVTPTNDVPTAAAVNASAVIATPKVITLTGADPETCDLTFTVLTQPSNGTLTGGGTITDKPCTGTGPYTDTAEVTYTATSGSSDSFTYKVTDGNAADSPSATVTITISASNTPPTANATSATPNEDTATPVALSGSDPESCELTFTLVNAPTKGTVNFAGQTPATCVPGSPNTDSASVTYTPNLNATGSDSFTYKVTDGSAVDSPAATASITITAVNDKPTANATSASTPMNTAKSVSLSGADVETCDLTFTIVATPGHGLLGSISDNPCAGAGPFTDSASVTYTPTTGYTGGDSFTYKVTDGNALDSTTVTATLTVTGGTPTTLTINPTDDAQVNPANSTNYGALNPFRTREENPVATSTYRLFFKFTVPSFSGAVSSVKLRLYVTTASANTQSVYSVLNTSWTEGTINGANAPAIETTVLGSSPASPVNSYIEISLPLNSVTSNSTVSFALKSSGTTSAYFYSKENATNKPELVIVAGP